MLCYWDYSRLHEIFYKVRHFAYLVYHVAEKARNEIPGFFYAFQRAFTPKWLSCGVIGTQWKSLPQGYNSKNALCPVVQLTKDVPTTGCMWQSGMLCYWDYFRLHEIFYKVPQLSEAFSWPEGVTKRSVLTTERSISPILSTNDRVNVKANATHTLSFFLHSPSH